MPLGKTELGVLKLIVELQRPVNAYEVSLHAPRALGAMRAQVILAKLLSAGYVIQLDRGFKATDWGRATITGVVRDEAMLKREDGERRQVAMANLRDAVRVAIETEREELSANDVLTVLAEVASAIK